MRRIAVGAASYFHPRGGRQLPEASGDVAAGRELACQAIGRQQTVSDKPDPGGFAPADPLRLRSRGPAIPAPLRRARPWRASPVMRQQQRVQSSRFEPHNGLRAAAGKTRPYRTVNGIKGDVMGYE